MLRSQNRLRVAPEPPLLLIGIDEAGYGPRLGPLCHGYCAIRYAPPETNGAEAPNLYKLLKASVRRCPAREGFVTIDDSKKVYSAVDGFELLRRGVETFLNCAALSSGDLFERILPQIDRERLHADRWGQPGPVLSEGPVLVDPVAPPKKRKPARKVVPLSAALTAANLSVVKLGARAMSARDYNSQLAKFGNKAEVNWSVIAVQLREILALAQPGEAIHAVIDRQGGRKFYLGKISELLPGSMPWIEAETARESVYRVEHDGRVMRISFVVEADGDTLPVALASMAAKLARELCMERLNGFFRTHAPELKPTAGYYGDASRFLRETRELRERLGISDAEFVRTK